MNFANMCGLRAHIKSSIFRNIFNSQENILKNRWLNVCPKGTHYMRFVHIIILLFLML